MTLGVFIPCLLSFVFCRVSSVVCWLLALLLCCVALRARVRSGREGHLVPGHAGRVLDVHGGQRGVRAGAARAGERVQDPQAARGGAEGGARSQVQVLYVHQSVYYTHCCYCCKQARRSAGCLLL